MSIEYGHKDHSRRKREPQAVGLTQDDVPLRGDDERASAVGGAVDRRVKVFRYVCSSFYLRTDRARYLT